MKKVTYPLIVIAMAGSVACTNMSSQEQGTVTGAGIGAVAGAAIAEVAGGSGWAGAAVGAVAGGIIGDIKGKEAQN